MKIKIHLALGLALLSTLNSQLSTLHAQGTAFTYQGRLNDNGGPANGHYDMLFSLYDAASGGSQVDGTLMGTAVPVTNGLFTVALDFGSGVFTGPGRWLKIDVRTNSGGAYTPLSPRQALTATPYAITAGNVTGVLPAAGLSGTYSGGVTMNNAANQFTGAFTGNGASVSNVNALTLGGLGAANFWKTGGNAGTTAGTHFLGTTDNQPLELKVNNARALRIEPNTNGSPNVIGGAAGNYAAAGVTGATIGGGGSSSLSNVVEMDFGTVGGGLGNRIGSDDLGLGNATIGGGAYNAVDSFFSSIGGGYQNRVRSEYATIAGGGNNDNSAYAGTIGGGLGNNTGAGSFYATIAGGSANNIGTDSGLSAIGGGGENDIGTNSSYSAIGGGNDNNIAANSIAATIPGGENNAATNYAFAAGRRAKANHQGAFVWGDSTLADIASANNNSVTMRAAGGYRLFSNTNATAGVSLAADGTAWAVISDRNLKKNFATVNPRAILEKLAALPITQWHYQWEETGVTPHIGPMAQDFKAAFYPGTDDKSITTHEADGVALAAIQGLNQKLTEELKQKQTEITGLNRRLERLEQMLNQKNGGRK